MREEVLIVSLATTLGWRTSEAELCASLERLGVAHRVERMTLGPEAGLRRTGAWPLTDWVEALGCRRGLRRGLAAGRPRALIFLSTTAALAAPLRRLAAEGIPAAVRVDCPAAVNRPGIQNAPQRRAERRRLAEAAVAMATGPRSAALLAPLAARVATVPVPVEPAARSEGGEAAGDVVLYAADPEKKGLDLVCRAWWALGTAAEGRRLLVTGVAAERGRRFLIRRGVAEPPGLVWCGELERDRYLELARGAAAFVSASVLEEAGLAQLEALAAGTPLATTPSDGAYEAYPLAAAIEPALAAPARTPEALAGALAAALAMGERERRAYGESARAALGIFGAAAADRALAEDVLPVLLGGQRRGAG